MDSIMPWAELESLIEPLYPKEGNGRPPLGLNMMRRIYFSSIGSTCRIVLRKRRCMIRRHCGGLQAWIWVVWRRRMRQPS
jgi:hypothetical protein